MLNLHLEYPDGKTEDLTLQSGVFQIGRTTDNDIVITHDTISRVHAELTVTKQHLRIKDLHSSSGTRLNGKNCTFEQNMKDGDNILLGLVAITISTQKKTNSPIIEDEKTRAFQKGELSTVLQELYTEDARNRTEACHNKKIIIGLCGLIIGLCIYIFTSR